LSCQSFTHNSSTHGTCTHFPRALSLRLPNLSLCLLSLSLSHSHTHADIPIHSRK
jgi:hypothetical protein